jgi:hypothetical protein
MAALRPRAVSHDRNQCGACQTGHCTATYGFPADDRSPDERPESPAAIVGQRAMREARFEMAALDQASPRGPLAPAGRSVTRARDGLPWGPQN